MGPDYLRVPIKATLYLEDDVPPATARARAIAALLALFHPLTGGPDGRGWPFGRDVQVSEIYEVLDKVPGIDFVRSVRLGDQTPAPSSVALKEYELVAVEVSDESFMTMEQVGDAWRQTG